jgi:hypothetical protein
MSWIDSVSWYPNLTNSLCSAQRLIYLDIAPTGIEPDWKLSIKDHSHQRTCLVWPISYKVAPDGCTLDKRSNYSLATYACIKAVMTVSGLPLGGPGDVDAVTEGGKHL